MSITSIKDAIKAIAQSLQLSTIIPALILVVINVLIIFPIAFPGVDWSFSNDRVLTAVIFITVSISYLLYAFNYPLIRIIEGHVGWDNPFMRPFKSIRTAKHREKYNKLISDKYSFMNNRIGQTANQKLDMHFPCDEKYILPTILGNTIAAFEHYPKNRYGIDSVVMWPRLLPILEKNNYLEFVSQQKTVFDFLVNMLYVVILSGVELTYLSCYLHRPLYIVCSLILTILLIFLLYLGIINGAVQWGTSVRVAFDLYRDELWETLRLRTVEHYNDEVEHWKTLSNFILLGDETEDFDLFQYAGKK